MEHKVHAGFLFPALWPHSPTTDRLYGCYIVLFSTRHAFFFIGFLVVFRDSFDGSYQYPVGSSIGKLSLGAIIRPETEPSSVSVYR